MSYVSSLLCILLIHLSFGQCNRRSGHDKELGESFHCHGTFA